MAQFFILNEKNLRKAYYDNELTQQECADLFGYSKRTIQSYFQKWKLIGRTERNDKWRQRIANKLTGNSNGKDIIFSDERKHNISDAVKQSWMENPNQGMVGKQHSEKTRQKIAKSHLKENLSDDALLSYRESAINRIERQIADGLPMTPSIGLQEKEILDKYEQIISDKIERQYRVAGFFVDGYCASKNIVFEVDEDYHKKRKEQDIYREEIIRRELGCDIIRIKA